jgi:predicted ribosome quality control (RQC) complex YloA/Tae2 family protein
LNEQTIQSVVEEITPLLVGRVMGKVFQLARAVLAIDFRTGDGRYLLLAAEPNQPRLYMVRRTVRELEKQSLAPTGFALSLRKHLGGATLQSINKDASERIVRFVFAARDALGDVHARTLVAQLTGRSANIFLLDDAARILDTLRPAHGTGQEIADTYQPPTQSTSPSVTNAADTNANTEAKPELATRQAAAQTQPPSPPPTSPTNTTPKQQFSIKPPPEFSPRDTTASLSDALDQHYRQLETARAFDARAAASTARLRQATEKRHKLRRNLERDLAAHGDADEHKRVGDLLLANIANAERLGSKVRLTDYYAEDAPIIELEIDENRTLQEEAAHRFARYTKARRAAQEIAQRLAELNKELVQLEAQRAELQHVITTRDGAALEAFDRGARTKDDRRPASPGEPQGTIASQKTTANIPGARRYRSSDGYEILVGRAAHDNDYLTFRVARSHDAWLHAADYPGSHVIIRNTKRGAEIPQRTIIEAAQLAAHFSQARKDAKVAVHYTERKFVSKMKGAARGLVRLSSFRTLLVEPRETVERI